MIDYSWNGWWKNQSRNELINKFLAEPLSSPPVSSSPFLSSRLVLHTREITSSSPPSQAPSGQGQQIL